MKAIIKNILNYVFALIFFPILLIYTLLFSKRGKKGIKVLWGPTPLKNIHYNSESLKLLGIESSTLVDSLYRNSSISDFDYYSNYFKNNFLNNVLSKYIIYFKIIKNYNILITNFDGGFLRGTPLRFIEHIFWKIGKKKVIVWPYGSDSFVYSQMQDLSFRYGLTKSYPASSKKDNLTKKQINYFTKNADFIVGNIPHNESCPKWDILTIACYGLDTEEWKPSYDYNYKKNAQLEPFKILHCPNHRAVKGTDFLIRACEELIKEGYNIDLQVVEKVSLKELQRKMKDCDIVASQFLYGYATNEIEGMSLAKPVLSNLENDYYYLAARRYTHIIECPILSTSPEKIKENIILLFENPELREELGKKGREYVLRYHSLEGQGLMWSKIINQVLTGSGDSLDEWWKERQTMKI